MITQEQIQAASTKKAYEIIPGDCFMKEEYHADLITAFEAGATWMQEQDQWIPVIEGLPEPHKRVEIFISNQYTTDHIAVGFVNNGKQWHALYNTPSEAGVYPVQYVTHWREIIGPK